MTHAEALKEVESIIDAQLAKAENELHRFEQRLRADGVNEDEIAAPLAGCRVDWIEVKAVQLLEVSDFLRSRLH